ncbi:MAG: DUF1902 domain-containing protein [Alphaproteobacteria bacterium]
MRRVKTYRVRAAWDAEAGVWIATSDDVPGLCCEAETWAELIDSVRELAPDLLVLNHAAPPGARTVTLRIVAEDERAVTLVA